MGSAGDCYDNAIRHFVCCWERSDAAYKSGEAMLTASGRTSALERRRIVYNYTRGQLRSVFKTPLGLEKDLPKAYSPNPSRFQRRPLSEMNSMSMPCQYSVDLIAAQWQFLRFLLLDCRW